MNKKENMARHIEIPLKADAISSLQAGDMVLLSGEVYTARDVAHRRLYEALNKGDKLPFDLKKAVIFYAAPAPTPPGKMIGSVGPTTSYRMDAFTPKLIEHGLKGMVGKGNRSPEAALSSQCVKKAELVAYEDLGPEAIRKLTVVDFPVIVINDPAGNDLYAQAENRWRINN